MRHGSLPFVLVMAAFVLGSSSSARALTVTLCDASATTCTPNLAPSGTSVTNPDGSKTWTLSAPFTTDSSIFTITNWTAQLATDPFVTNNFLMTNTGGSAQTFIATVVLPISAFNYNQIVNSSVGLTVTDSNGDGSASAKTVSGIAIYTGTINGVGALPLLPDPSSVIVSTAGFSNTISANFASGPAGPGSATSIGIMLEFTLSPGDSAGLTSRFEIVPEPTTGLLLTSGLIGLAALGSRRRA
jgi:hypothetical protein